MNYFCSSCRLAGFIIAIALLSGCSQLQSLQDRFAADPKLVGESTKLKSDSEASRGDPAAKVSLPTNFPVAIPRFPRAELISANDAGKTVWKSTKSSDRILNFYQTALQSNGWEIIQPFSSETEGNQALIASLENLKITISLEPEQPDNATNFAISYQTNQIVAEPQTKEVETSLNQVENTKNQTSQPLKAIKPAPLSYSDLDKTPDQLRPYVQEVIALGSIAIDPENSLFEPNKTVTRREFARWLVRTNNRIYSHRPSQEIRLATSIQKPAFKDIPVSDPDYAYIQGLAEAGIIPSILSGDSSEILFRPDAALTREDFIIWKVPLDLRRSLPSASIQAVEQTWGFEDSAQIDPLALRSLLVDFQNGENSNVRRAFGYTVLFQPNKNVTRAEAVAAFWYFGYQGDGISAEQALKIQN
ncbi:MAG: S-layer homology domain-containing protein [Prochloraceae cyanobacterium]|nr:S-layer homology domain-containing protein [Prochloraceae cyanobacterium]